MSQSISPQWSAVRPYQVRFPRRSHGRITAVAKVSAGAGTEAQVTWNPGGYRSVTEFENPHEYWHWPSISMDQLSNRHCSIEYCLDGIRWATVKFQLMDLKGGRYG